MKKYFAKYLPVDGKIKIDDLVEGDRIYGLMIRDDNDEDFVFSRKASKTTVYCDRGFEFLPKKKIKLFICSREFEMGDEITYTDGILNTISVIGFLESIRLSYKDNKFGGNGHYKKIGEISSSAIWVKNGDEFDNNDIEMVYNAKKECLCETVNWWTDTNSCDHEIEDHYNRARMCGRHINVVREVKIKCPTCNNFH